MDNHWDSLDCPRVQSEDASEATIEKLVDAINTVLDKAESLDESKQLDQIMKSIKSSTVREDSNNNSDCAGRSSEHSSVRMISPKK